MKLFETPCDKNFNLLPGGGIVNYFGRIMKQEKADLYLEALLSGIDWKNGEAVIFGRHIVTKRKVAWYGDSGFSYTYSNITKEALAWTPELTVLKKMVEELTEERYNSCLLNLYHNGDEGMAYHSDGEKDLKKNGAIASLSLGAERTFAFRHKLTKERISLVLEHGSLLVMKGETQTNWLHRLPPTKRVHNPRVNLTFRTIVR
jgi:alkylated DNA repair dioxygenase AlkB